MAHDMTTVRTCAITGANGYVGSAIAAYMKAQGLRVIAFNRSSQRPAEADSAVIPFMLGQEVAPDAFAGVDILVHCAYDFDACSWEDIKRLNVDGTLRLFATASAAGVKRIICISTLSAFDGCLSLYGQAKLAIERVGNQYGAIAVRPGLVFDAGEPRGMVGALGAVIARSPIVPLIGGGWQVLYPCHADDLARLVCYLCTAPDVPPSPIPAAAHEGLTFKTILARMAAAKRKRVLFVPIPYLLVLTMLRGVERLGLRTRLRSDSLVSLMNQNPTVDFSALDATHLTFRDFAIGRDDAADR